MKQKTTSFQAPEDASAEEAPAEPKSGGARPKFARQKTQQQLFPDAHAEERRGTAGVWGDRAEEEERPYWLEFPATPEEAPAEPKSGGARPKFMKQKTTSFQAPEDASAEEAPAEPRSGGARPKFA